MLLHGPHYQNAYVTRNVEKAMADFRAAADVRKEMFHEGEQTVETPDGPQTLHNKIAFMWVEDLQYEFIEPVSGLEHVYAQALPDHDGVAFHHVCSRVPDWEALHAQIAQHSWTVPFESVSAGGLKYLYVDARPWLGHYLEFTWMPDEMWTALGGR